MGNPDAILTLQKASHPCSRVRCGDADQTALRSTSYPAAFISSATAYIDQTSIKDTVQSAVGKGIDLAGANLSLGDFVGANLQQGRFQGANFAGSNLFQANLSGADLRGAILSKSILLNANFRNADLAFADLTDTRIEGVSFKQANLRGAVMTAKKRRDRIKSWSSPV